MNRAELAQQLEEVVTETTTLPSKDKDRLLDALTTFVVDELGVELEEDEDGDEEEE